MIDLKREQNKKNNNTSIVTSYFFTRFVLFYILYNIYIFVESFKVFQEIVQSLFSDLENESLSVDVAWGWGVVGVGIVDVWGEGGGARCCLTLLIRSRPHETEDRVAIFNPSDLSAIQTGTIWRLWPWSCSLIGLPW